MKPLHSPLEEDLGMGCMKYGGNNLERAFEGWGVAH
jgi:hypothetical protein